MFILVASVHKTLFQKFCGSSLYFFTNCRFRVVCLWYSLYIAALSSLKSWLRCLHPCPLEIVCDVPDWCFQVFLNRSRKVSVFYCCFLWSTCLMFVAQHANGFFLFQDIQNCCTSYPQCLCNRFPFFSKLQNGLLFSQRQLSDLYVGLSFLTQMQFSQAKPKAQTKSRHSELFIV